MFTFVCHRLYISHKEGSQSLQCHPSPSLPPHVAPFTIRSPSHLYHHHYRSQFLSLALTVATVVHCLPFTVVMNAFPNGACVFYWDVNGTIIYGTVESTSRMTDGTLVINVKVDGGSVVSLPASSVSKVT